MEYTRYLAAAVLAVAPWAGNIAQLSANDKSKLATATVAHIRLAGDLDEAPAASEPLFGNAAENFKDKLARIKKARDDSAVHGLLLQVDGLAVGWGKLDELRRAIADFRKSGKKVYAYLESGESKDYLAAAACDAICLPESGWLMLTGMRAEVSFYKDLLDKIGVKADLLQMGDFKGAAEPFTRSGMSPQFRKQFESVLDDYFSNLVQTIAASRKDLTPDKVRQLIDEGPYTAARAVEVGLVDRVGYVGTFQETFKADLNADKVKLVKNYALSKSEEPDFSNPLALLKLFTRSKPAESTKPKLALIYLVGTIATGKSMESPFGEATVGSTTLVEAIRQAEQDKTVKAIVLRVDSPGGSALASDLIWNELRQSKKPVIASMGDTAASGGYYVSMAARKIFAEPGTLTGSIGVVGGKLVLGGVYDKIGLKTEIITRGAHANILASTTPFSEAEARAMKALMKDTYDQFLTKALQGRQRAGREMTRAELEKLAGGRIWTGRQAKASGLVDELGTLDDALAAARTMAQMDKDAEPELLILPRTRNFLDTLLESRSEASLRQLPLVRVLPELARQAGALEGLLRLRGEPVWTLLPCRVDVR
jgi:protease-4